MLWHLAIIGKVWLHLSQVTGQICFWSTRDIVTTALTHDSELIELPVLLALLCPWNEIPESDSAQRDEAEVYAVQERPGHLQCAEYGRRSHKEAQHHQNHQQQEVDHGGRPRLHAWTLKEADWSENQRVHEPLDAGGEHQHGEGDSYQGIEDGESLSSVRQRCGLTITWKYRKRTAVLEQEGNRKNLAFYTKKQSPKPCWAQFHVFCTFYLYFYTLFHFSLFFFNQIVLFWTVVCVLENKVVFYST